MNAGKFSRGLGIVLTLFAAGWVATVLYTIPESHIPGTPGPRTFPLLLGTILGFLGLVLVFSPAKLCLDVPSAITNREVKVVGGTFLVLFGYAFLLGKIGFVLATPLVVILVFKVMMGIRSWTKTLATAIIIPAVCWLIFVQGFEANLPRGTWLNLL
ncbi:tripartite tricarboxylate transporter TctB family protein [Telmatospirillum sp. J64-1]|uniref:tripartite tricarboxylate transporter TctB family protein n=1 Tax=Telmatospirillum sp. J64-1 TaxID=2502183 RepID=UPI00115E95CD|nr:tripartite tricarboxylate transporter TctB family protein [Telmatospirillum sp. J64-1]